MKRSGLDKAQDQAEEISQLGTHIKAFFSERVRDYSLVKNDTLKAMAEITEHFKKCHELGL